MGGKSPFIVLDDAAIDAMIEGAMKPASVTPLKLRRWRTSDRWAGMASQATRGRAATAQYSMISRM